MTKRSYSFYDLAPIDRAGKDPRALPMQKRATTAHSRLSSGVHPLLATEEAAATRLTEEILDRLCSENGRMLSKKSATPFATLYGVLTDLCPKSSLLCINPSAEDVIFPTVAVCAHNLFFCIAGVLHSATREGRRITMTAHRAEDGADIVLSLDQPALLGKEVEEAFGISSTNRIVLQKIASVSSFSLEFRPGERAAAAFRLPLYRAETFTLYSSDTLESLRRVFALAALYFA